MTNTFGNYHRQNVAVDSWKYLKSLFPVITIIDCQFSDEKNSHTPYDGISTDYCLTRSSLDLVSNATKKLPILYDIIKRGFDD
ncbi:MAG TPA: hypothetical protein PKU78_06335, partial [Candidatus Dojkabacteria bacterium]|nr:hypothetical protein [Candidatus Dojkabacteria bacterium]